MRFRELQSFINSNIGGLIFTSEKLKTGYIQVDNYYRVITTVNDIASLGLIDEEMQNLVDNSNILNITPQSKNMTMQEPTFKRFESTINSIISKLQAVSYAIDMCLPEQSPLSVTVGLPDYHSFSDIPDFSKNLNKVFTLYFGKDADGIEIQNFDSGSLWYEIAFASTALVVSFGSLVMLVNYCYAKIRQHKIAEIQYKELDLKQEVRKELSQALTDKITQDIQSDVVHFLSGENDESPDPEKTASTIKAVIKLFDLIDSGATFETAIDANDKIKESFPKLKDLMNLPTTSKLSHNQERPVLIDTIENEEEAQE
ncbi:hypothetical protein [uncultured Enterococcus sp.]|uniref:hypothetical protein n=1 Tax=uncultured Enterococcus sp. TaxID=167972 RepID=UPI002AA7CCA0|nr:hypothetical protein [uncultured Enterococcus sp.]